MASLIVPRQIALVTTVDRGGAVNAAPLSMFAMVGEDPPLVMISVNTQVGDEQKDTARNIDATNEFVVHITDEPMAEKMRSTSTISFRSGGSVPASTSARRTVSRSASP